MVNVDYKREVNRPLAITGWGRRMYLADHIMDRGEII